MQNPISPGQSFSFFMSAGGVILSNVMNLFPVHPFSHLCNWILRQQTFRIDPLEGSSPSAAGLAILKSILDGFLKAFSTSPDLLCVSIPQCASFNAMMEDLGISLRCYKGLRRRSRLHAGGKSACVLCQPKRAAKRDEGRRDSST